MIQPNSEAIRIPAPGVCRGSITSRSASQNGPSPAAWMAGTEGPAAASARTASLASGHSFVTVTLPRSRGMKPAETSISSITPGRPVSPWRMLASPWLRGDSSMILKEVRHEADMVRAAPEGQAEPPAGHQHPGRLPQRRLAAFPDPVEAGGHVEAGAGERQGEHVAEPEIAVGCPCPGDPDQRVGASIPATAAPRRAAS